MNREQFPSRAEGVEAPDKQWSRRGSWLLLLLAAMVIGASSSAAQTPFAEPLSGNPGNVYVAGQSVRVPVPRSLAAEGTEWRLLDDRHRVQRSGRIDPDPSSSAPEPLLLGMLSVGWYRIEFGATNAPAQSWTTAAVLEPCRVPVPLDSPVSLDVASSWFARDDVAGQERFASLAALAGVSWVRDRLRWRDLQPEAGALPAGKTTYDTAAEIQHRFGLQILQVFHDSPTWAHQGKAATGRLAPDLRHVHQFARELAHRFRGRVAAWEPWNEANAPAFGGHTVDQMCSWQKAAWLGFKAGDPDVIVGWNPTAGVPTPEHTRGVLQNETWPYFDTYNIHTYDWSHSYADLWAPAREASSGRPLWITEADRGTMHLNNAPWFDIEPRLEQLKAEWIAQSYASSLFAGATRHFHFILGHYHEPQGVQFGLLRHDLTPRPAYVALAAVGRLLAGAKILGRWQPMPDVHVYAFRAKPNGQSQDVLVIYAERDVDWDGRGVTTADWHPPENLEVQEVVDYLGRSLGTSFPAPLTSAPVFVRLPPGQAARLPLTSPPPLAEPRRGEASPVVLQLDLPRSMIVSVEDLPWSEGHAYAIRPGTTELTLHIYNFSEQPAMVRLDPTDPPSGWHTTWPTRELHIMPGERATLIGTLNLHASTETRDCWIQLRANTEQHGRPALACRFVVQP
jgi:hypothetical protein